VYNEDGATPSGTPTAGSAPPAAFSPARFTGLPAAGPPSPMSAAAPPVPAVHTPAPSPSPNKRKISTDGPVGLAAVPGLPALQGAAPIMPFPVMVQLPGMPAALAMMPGSPGGGGYGGHPHSPLAPRAPGASPIGLLASPGLPGLVGLQGEYGGAEEGSYAGSQQGSGKKQRAERLVESAQDRGSPTGVSTATHQWQSTTSTSVSPARGVVGGLVPQALFSGVVTSGFAPVASSPSLIGRDSQSAAATPRAAYSAYDPPLDGAASMPLMGANLLSAFPAYYLQSQRMLAALHQGGASEDGSAAAGRSSIASGGTVGGAAPWGSPSPSHHDSGRSPLSPLPRGLPFQQQGSSFLQASQAQQAQQVTTGLPAAPAVVTAMNRAPTIPLGTWTGEKELAPPSRNAGILGDMVPGLGGDDGRFEREDEVVSEHEV
jgi:hypothetical protein